MRSRLATEKPLLKISFGGENVLERARGRLGDEIKMLGRMGTRRMTKEGISQHKGHSSSVSSPLLLLSQKKII